MLCEKCLYRSMQFQNRIEKMLGKVLCKCCWRSLRKKCLYSELFWSECGKIRTRITPNTEWINWVNCSLKSRDFDEFQVVWKTNCLWKSFCMISFYLSSSYWPFCSPRANPVCKYHLKYQIQVNQVNKY